MIKKRLQIIIILVIVFSFVGCVKRQSSTKSNNPLVPKPNEQLGSSQLPFNPSGCPYLYLRGSDREAMSENASLTVNIYGRDYRFVIGTGNQDLIRAIVSTKDFGQDLFHKLHLSDEDYKLFYNELDEFKKDCNIQLTAMDIGNDDECELLLTLQSESHLITKTFVFKLLPHPYRTLIAIYLGVVTGQVHMHVSGDAIIAPYESKGLYDEYILRPDGRIIRASTAMPN